MRVLLTITGIILAMGLQAQSSVKGLITDEKNEPLSFVSVFVRGTQTGTTCNEKGRYELRLSPGNYELVFQYIGYVMQIVPVTLGDHDNRELNIRMQPSAYQLNEVKINATAEDPAYPIMRQVIARRGIYRHEAKEYSCRVYMKGLQRLTTIPKRVMLFKIPEDVKPGIVYLSESLSELNVRAPGQVKEKLISSKVSGDNQAFSYNQASALQFTLYDNIVPSYGLNQRGFISPLASNAMMYYRYKLIGESQENGAVIFKVKIIPIRKNDPVFKGHIYIVKDSWRLHSTDLILDQDAGIDFVDTLYVKQNYARQPSGVWMPVSQRLIFQLGILGFRGNGYFVSVFSNYKVMSLYPPAFYANENKALEMNLPTPQVRKVEKVKPNKIPGMEKFVTKKKTKINPTDSSLFAANFFNKEVLLVDKSANKTDDSTWEAIRPIPLSEEEVKDYHEKDSAEAVTTSKHYMDSMDRIRNKLDWSSFTLSDYTYARSYERQYFTVEPILTVLQYNTVEGLVINPRIRFAKEFKDETEYSIAPHLRYSVARKEFNIQGTITWKYDAIMGTTVRLAGGVFVEQINRNNPISPAVNTAYTLLLEENHMKLYRKAYIRPSYSSEIVNGISLTAAMEFAHRMPMANAAFDKAYDRPGVNFTSNDPVINELPLSGFSAHNALTLDLQFRFVIGQRYATRPNERWRYGSKYPRIYASYRKGIPGLSSTIDFDEVNLWVNDGISLNLFGRFHYFIKLGSFLNSSTMYAMDYHHFEGNRTIIANQDFRGFQLMDYYRYSTSHHFAEFHLDHHFNGFILNKIPLIRKLKWQEVVSMNYLSTTSSTQYTELAVGIEHIFKVLRIDYFRSFDHLTFLNQGILIGFGF